MIAITNARIHPITRPDIERGTIVMRGGKIEALGADVAVAVRRARSSMPQAADVYPGFINARTQMGLNEPGPARLRGRRRDARPQPAAAHRGGVPRRERSDSASRAPTASRRSASCRREACSAAQMAVMNLDGWTWEEATLQAERRHDVQLPRASAAAAGAAAAAAEAAAASGGERTTRT